MAQAKRSPRQWRTSLGPRASAGDCQVLRVDDAVWATARSFTDDAGCIQVLDAASVIVYNNRKWRSNRPIR